MSRHIRAGKRLVLGRKKRNPDRSKPPLHGERKAFRKRIQLSNDNALEVPGLDQLSPETVVNPESVGKMVSIPVEVIDQLRTCEAFKSSQNWSLFRSPHMLVRKETVDLAKQMTDAIEKKETLRLVVTGDRGSGKSILGLQALATGFMNKWVVINIPEGGRRCSTVLIDTV
jgi:small subunit ribosomal protein S29